MAYLADIYEVPKGFGYHYHTFHGGLGFVAVPFGAGDPYAIPAQRNKAPYARSVIGGVTGDGERPIFTSYDGKITAHVYACDKFTEVSQEEQPAKLVIKDWRKAFGDSQYYDYAREIATLRLGDIIERLPVSDTSPEFYKWECAVAAAAQNPAIHDLVRDMMEAVVNQVVILAKEDLDLGIEDGGAS